MLELVSKLHCIRRSIIYFGFCTFYLVQYEVITKSNFLNDSLTADCHTALILREKKKKREKGFCMLVNGVKPFNPFATCKKQQVFSFTRFYMLNTTEIFEQMLNRNNLIHIIDHIHICAYMQKALCYSFPSCTGLFFCSILESVPCPLLCSFTLRPSCLFK